MPIWMHNALTVLSPLQGMYLATLGAIAFGVVVASKKPKTKYAAMVVYIVGAYGFASAITGALHG